MIANCSLTPSSTHTTLYKISEKIWHRTSNLYQIFSYVKNKQAEVQANDIEVSGMLLYARTSESIQPDSDYVMSGNRISVKTLDLNRQFSELNYLNFKEVEDS